MQIDAAQKGGNIMFHKFEIKAHSNFIIIFNSKIISGAYCI